MTRSACSTSSEQARGSSAVPAPTQSHTQTRMATTWSAVVAGTTRSGSSRRIIVGLIRGTGYRLMGDRGSDVILGSPRRDFLRGGMGADKIEGHGGNDTLRGNRGADTLRGNRGADTLRGNRGADTLRGNAWCRHSARRVRHGHELRRKRGSTFVATHPERRGPLLRAVRAARSTMGRCQPVRDELKAQALLVSRETDAPAALAPSGVSVSHPGARLDGHALVPVPDGTHKLHLNRGIGPSGRLSVRPHG